MRMADRSQARQRWHIVDGEPRRCVALPGHCPYGGVHYDDFGKASRAAERQNRTRPATLGRRIVAKSTEAVRKVNEDHVLQERMERAKTMTPKIPLPDRKDVQQEWSEALDGYRRFVAEGGADPIPVGARYEEHGVTRSDALHVAAKTVWMMREGRQIVSVNSTSRNCIDDVDHHGLSRPAFGTSFADPRMAVDAAYMGLRSEVLDDVISRGMTQVNAPDRRWSRSYRDRQEELDRLSREIWPELDDAGRRKNVDTARDQMITFLAVDHKAIGMMAKTLMFEPVMTGDTARSIYNTTNPYDGRHPTDGLRGGTSDHFRDGDADSGLSPLDSVILDSGRSLGDVMSSRTPGYVSVPFGKEAKQINTALHGGDPSDPPLPDAMIWNADLRDPREGKITSSSAAHDDDGTAINGEVWDGGKGMIQGDLGF